MKTPDPVIRTLGLNYNFGSQRVVRELALSVPESAIYGFLGPNGAGKSTTIKLLLGLLQTPGEHIFLLGKELNANRLDILAEVGCLIETPSLYGHLTGYENLRYLDKLFQQGKGRIEEALRTVGLWEHRDKKAKAYSLGMKQRLGIAMAIFHDPRLLFLDEPFNGLDPSGVMEMRRLLERLRDQGKTIFLSSHILAEIEKTCSHVGIISKGEMLYQGEMTGLLSHATQRVSLLSPDLERAAQVCADGDFESKMGKGPALELTIGGPEEFNRLVYHLTQRQVPIHSLQSHSSSLEDIFIQLTQS